MCLRHEIRKWKIFSGLLKILWVLDTSDHTDRILPSELLRHFCVPALASALSFLIGIHDEFLIPTSKDALGQVLPGKHAHRLTFHPPAHPINTHLGVPASSQALREPRIQRLMRRSPCLEQFPLVGETDA